MSQEMVKVGLTDIDTLKKEREEKEAMELFDKVVSGQTEFSSESEKSKVADENIDNAAKPMI
jgi:hypothetical protein